MCWFTLAPAKGKRQAHRTSDSSCVEDIVRVHRSPASPRFTDTRVRMPSMSVDVQDNHALLHPHLQHQHRHPHIHPLLSHPIHGHYAHLYGGHNALGFDFGNVREVKLGGHGRKRSSSPPPLSLQPREPTRSSPPPPPSSPSQEPIYHTQVVQPSPPLPGVRQTTRAALRRQPQERARLRRVAGYEVLGKQVPWDWDCVSSTGGSSAAPGGGRWVRNRASNLKYPPFGSMERWL